MSHARVSICIPAYRLAEPVLKALESVRIQTFRDYEVVVTDDSPDDSVERALETMDFSGRLRYQKNQQRLGAPENWNESIRLARGEYIKILHHDDWFAGENSLAAFVDLLDTDPQADFGFSASADCLAGGEARRVHCASRSALCRLEADPKRLFHGNVVGSPSATIFRSSVNERFDPRLRWVVDIDFYIRILRANRRFAFSSEPLVCVSIDSEDRVTAECKGHKSVELQEYVYLLKKVWGDTWVSGRSAKFVLDLMCSYDVRSRKDLVACGVDLPLPRSVERLLALLRIWRFIYAARKHGRDRTVKQRPV